MILPDFAGEGPVDLRANYHGNARWLYALVIGGTLTSLAKDLVLDGHLPDRTNVAFHCFWIALAVVAALYPREWFHKLVALSAAVVITLYIALLFVKLS